MFVKKRSCFLIGIGIVILIVVKLVNPIFAYEGKVQTQVEGPNIVSTTDTDHLKPSKSSVDTHNNTAFVEKIGQPSVLGELVAGVLLGNFTLIGIHFFDLVADHEIIRFLAERGFFGQEQIIPIFQQRLGCHLP